MHADWESNQVGHNNIFHALLPQEIVTMRPDSSASAGAKPKPAPKKRNPLPEDQLPNQYFVDIGQKAQRLDALETDVAQLMNEFRRIYRPDFEPYRETWRQLNFSAIHFACVEKTGREPFMQNLYLKIFNFLPPNPVHETILGVLYALYLLYSTQPKLFDLVPIPIDLRLANILEDFHEYCIDNDWGDAIYVYSLLQNKGAFAISSVVNPVPGVIASNHCSREYLTGNQLLQLKNKILASSLHQATVGPANLSSRLKGVVPLALLRPQAGGVGANTNDESSALDELRKTAEAYQALKVSLTPTAAAHQASRKLSLITFGTCPPNPGESSSGYGHRLFPPAAFGFAL
ncbi:small nuclear RNA activating complex, subunit SNAP43-domain-containing protein [Dimargaris cristalligena]|uniref:Small nuclear RNA activating complex, subunit SNAP43-domain-containing protein n=1 Tax=Dimargaris cristalligena TaxID=215637 RepID=A0A4P9ZZE4_9FUNG|nr:small nuclear RNA activating complex, subunit SNAP43-domain-containing protein [Dimargaris cristalligena]|eukprot:RKP39077.1 small nuclear RNA activating complex, subunit SNAP43-domain-containing protein [Dimargaris cristalligena]